MMMIIIIIIIIIIVEVVVVAVLVLVEVIIIIMEDGIEMTALRLLSSKDKPAINDETTVNTLRVKHPVTPIDGRPFLKHVKTILLCA